MQGFTGAEGPAWANQSCTAVTDSHPLIVQLVNTKYTLNKSCDFIQDPTLLANFINQFRRDLCNSVVPAIASEAQCRDRFRVENVTCGSTIVNLTVLPSSSASDPSAKNLLEQLQTQLGNPDSTLMKQMETSSSLPSQNFLTAATTTDVVGCPGGGFAASANACPEPGPEGNGVDKNLALGLGLGFGIPYVVVLVIVIYRSRTKALQNKGADNGIPLTPLEKEKKGQHDDTADGPPGLEFDQNQTTPAKPVESSGAGSPSEAITIS
jgi:hypothetical protein